MLQLSAQHMHTKTEVFLCTRGSNDKSQPLYLPRPVESFRGEILLMNTQHSTPRLKNPPLCFSRSRLRPTSGTRRSGSQCKGDVVYDLGTGREALRLSGMSRNDVEAFLATLVRCQLATTFFTMPRPVLRRLCLEQLGPEMKTAVTPKVILDPKSPGGLRTSS